MSEVGEKQGIRGVLSEYLIPIVSGACIFFAGAATVLTSENDGDTDEINRMEDILNSGGVVQGVGVGLHDLFTLGREEQERTGVLRIGDPLYLDNGSVAFVLTDPVTGEIDLREVSTEGGTFVFGPDDKAGKAGYHDADITVVNVPDGPIVVINDPLQYQVGEAIFPSAY